MKDSQGRCSEHNLRFSDIGEAGMPLRLAASLANERAANDSQGLTQTDDKFNRLVLTTPKLALFRTLIDENPKSR
jgi:hypothetical protein